MEASSKSSPNEEPTSISTSDLEQTSADEQTEATNTVDGGKLSHKNEDSLSDTAGDVSQSPASDEKDHSADSEGFHDEHSNYKPSADKEPTRKTVKDKIVPGAISRGVDFQLLLILSPFLGISFFWIIAGF